jgi:hypothetical protein
MRIQFLNYLGVPYQVIEIVWGCLTFVCGEGFHFFLTGELWLNRVSGEWLG